MKLKVKNILAGVVGAGMSALLGGCAAETPFEDEGTGTIYLRTVISNVTTRAAGGYTVEQLADNCVVRISRCNGISEGDAKTKDGLVYRVVGLSNVDSKIILKPGNYVAEAWTGDSAAAAYDKKFFKAVTPFKVEDHSIKNIDLLCKIQNVIVSINPDSPAFAYMEDDYSIKIDNNGSQLTLDKNNLKGYFMITADANAAVSFAYEITGKKKGATDTFTKTGTIGVKRSHEYILKLDYTSNNAQLGGATFNIDIKEEEVGDDNNQEKPLLPTDPTITGAGFDIGNPLVLTNPDDIPEELGVVICTVGNGLSAMTLTVNSASYDVLNTQPELPAGIEWVAPGYDANSNVSTAYLIFKKIYISGLSGKNDIKISVTDTKGNTTEKTLKIER